MTPKELAEREILGFTEHICVKGPEKDEIVEARVDSGAVKSSIDLKLASQLRLGPIVESKLIKSANGAKLRPVIEVEVIICGKTIKERFTMADRSHMRYKILIGQNILTKGFLIDPLKKG